MEQSSQSKRCPKCDTEKPLTSFSVKKSDNRPTCWCKDCVNRSSKERYQRNKKNHNSKQKDWYQKNKDSHNEKRKHWYRQNTQRYRDTYLVRKYKITLEEYDRMFESQSGVCAICGKVEQSRVSLAVDHDHKTGAVRQLLCTKCNKGLGHFDDDIELFQKAIEYIKKHSK
jgi:hypothetical protein